MDNSIRVKTPTSVKKIRVGNYNCKKGTKHANLLVQMREASSVFQLKQKKDTYASRTGQLNWFSSFLLIFFCVYWHWVGYKDCQLCDALRNKPQILQCGLTKDKRVK